MRVDVTPRHTEAVPGQATPFTLTISNTSTVIGGYARPRARRGPRLGRAGDGRDLAVPGREPGHRLHRHPARGHHGRRPADRRPGAGADPAGVHATSSSSTCRCRPRPSVQLRVDPLTVTAGRHAPFSLVVDEQRQHPGRTTARRATTRRTGCGSGSTRRRSRSSPGEHAVVDLRASARRPFLGSPPVRMLGALPRPADGSRTTHGAGAAGRPGGRGAGHFIQRPVLSRGGDQPAGAAGGRHGVRAGHHARADPAGGSVGRGPGPRAAGRRGPRTPRRPPAPSSARAPCGCSPSGKPVAGVSVALYSADSTRRRWRRRRRTTRAPTGCRTCPRARTR